MSLIIYSAEFTHNSLLGDFDRRRYAEKVMCR